MSSTVMTRQMWCERCFKAGRPHAGLQFIVIGSTGFHLRQVERWVPKNERGFTPHLVSAFKLLDDNTVAISRVCGILGCGLSLKDDPQDRNKGIFTYEHVTYEQLTLSEWNSIVSNKDLGYKI